MTTDKTITPPGTSKGLKVTFSGDNSDWPGIAFIAATCIAGAPGIKGFEGLPEDFGSFLVGHHLITADTVTKITTDLGLGRATTHLGAVTDVAELSSTPSPDTTPIIFKGGGKDPHKIG